MPVRAAADESTNTVVAPKPVPTGFALSIMIQSPTRLCFLELIPSTLAKDAGIRHERRIDEQDGRPKGTLNSLGNEHGGEWRD